MTQKRTLLGDLLGWGVETIARGLARGAESVLGDAEKALARKRQGVESWREAELDAMGGDAPVSDSASADSTGPRKAVG